MKLEAFLIIVAIQRRKGIKKDELIRVRTLQKRMKRKLSHVRAGLVRNEEGRGGGGGPQGWSVIAACTLPSRRGRRANALCLREDDVTWNLPGTGTP